ncbi:hypothetical protein [Yersinia kristensenii]|uniref:hypothetical protein n=1 Tax=Yersinia kristensenii TaxID=28152 RepID=UPI0016439387|nr:hypothetical protein [Yersinia kristensenii]
MSSYAMVNPNRLIVNVIAKAQETEIPIPNNWQLIDITGLSVGIGCTYKDGLFIYPDIT